MASLTPQQRTIDIIYNMLNHGQADFADPLEPKLVDLGADSLDSIEISMELEQEFGIEISDEEVDALSIQTVGDWWKLVDAKLGRASA